MATSATTPTTTLTNTPTITPTTTTTTSTTTPTTTPTTLTRSSAPKSSQPTDAITTITHAITSIKQNHSQPTISSNQTTTTTALSSAIPQGDATLHAYKPVAIVFVTISGLLLAAVIILAVFLYRSRKHKNKTKAEEGGTELSINPSSAAQETALNIAGGTTIVAIPTNSSSDSGISNRAFNTKEEVRLPHSKSAAATLPSQGVHQRHPRKMSEQLGNSIVYENSAISPGVVPTRPLPQTEYSRSKSDSASNVIRQHQTTMDAHDEAMVSRGMREHALDRGSHEDNSEEIYINVSTSKMEPPELPKSLPEEPSGAVEEEVYLQMEGSTYHTPAKRVDYQNQRQIHGNVPQSGSVNEAEDYEVPTITRR